MKTKLSSLLVAVGLLVAAAWSMQAPTATPTEEVPEKYRATLRKGLKYLLTHQFDDGHWQGTDGKHPVATTALVGMALLMDETPPRSKYTANIRRAANWLMSKSQPQRNGLIYSNHASETDRYMEGHGFATQFLAWACRDEIDEARRKKLYEAVSRAVDYIVKAQSSQGGWYPTSKVEGHDLARISSTAIQLQALRMASNTIGVPLGGGVTTDAQEYLKSEIQKRMKESGSGSNPRLAADLAAALVCRVDPHSFLNQDGIATEWAKRCRTEMPMGEGVKIGRDELAHCWYAQALYNRMLNESTEAATAWNEYRTKMFDALLSSQAKDGSWSAGPETADAEGSVGVGPVYSTAVWCIVLQFDKKTHPLTKEIARFTY
jgi:hypothetical protein